jgi:hypothetical protein
MKGIWTRVAAMLVLLSALALAQDELSVLERYALAVDHLSSSVASLEADPSESLESLSRAENAFRLLARETRSEALRSGLVATFEQARIAINRRSDTDLAVRAALIRGGLQRIVYEATLSEAGAGDLTLVRAQLSRLAADIGFSAEARAAIDGGSGSLVQLLTAFEVGVGEAIAARLERAQGQDTQDAYLALAEAYAAFIPIQDSLHAADTTTDAFVSAINALLEGDRESFLAELAGLEGQIAGLRGLADGESVVESAAPFTVFAAAAPLPTAPEDPAVMQEAAAEEPATVESAVGAEGSAQDIEANLAPYGLEPTVLARLVAAYEAAGYLSPAGVLAHLYATSAQVVVAVQDGQTLTAQTTIASLRQDYQSLLQPLVQVRQPEAHLATLDLFYGLEAAPALNLQDAAVLAAQVNGLAAALEGEPLALKQQANVLASLYWPGSIRAGLLVLLALLAFYPLYLLNLAFGGGNRYWRWVSAALFLLLLPLIYEGLAQAGALIAYFTDMSEFAMLLAFSPFQNPLAQLVWALLSALAILFATYGLRGICAQFGLMGRRKRAKRGGLQDAKGAKAGEAAFD